MVLLTHRKFLPLVPYEDGVGVRSSLAFATKSSALCLENQTIYWGSVEQNIWYKTYM